MSRLPLIVVAALAFALPGAYSVATSASAAPPAQGAMTPISYAVGDAGDAQVGGSSGSPSASPSSSPSPIDTVPPVTTASGADARWHRLAVTVRLEADDATSVVASTLYKVGAGGAWTRGTKIVVPAPKDHTNDGQHVISFYSVDTAQNAEAIQTVTVKIDTTPPGFRWRDVSPTVLHRMEPVTFRFTIWEPSGPVRLAWRATDQYGFFAARRGGLERLPGTRVLQVTPRSKDRRPFTPGLYRVRLTLTDQAGNVTVTKPRVFRDYRPAQARVFHRVSGAGRRVALTFDDGGDGPWASMLRTLRAYRAHATFFPLGPWVDRALARRTVADGNALGSHGWTHTAMTTQSYSGVRNEWLRSEVPWWSAAGATPVPYCRPPYGDYNGTTVAAAGSAGFTRVILWDVDPQDWQEPGSGVIAARVLSHVHSGAIVCMHLRAQTAAALPAILRGLRARGYKAVSLPELFRAAGYR
jgi:peptidoglycan/xylan/chitin deacetylase (PgdA/CDA1 family)